MTRAENTDTRILAWCVGALGVLVVAALFRDLSLEFLKVPLDTREGWNAYHAAAAWGGTLYPVPPSMIYNNYPPLSFLLAGGLGRFIGDDILAGRLIALISTLGAALAVGLAARAMGCRKIEAAFSSLLFVANPWIALQFASIDDPQMLGQFLGCAGFALLVREPRGERAIVGGALLLTLAGFVKPLFIIQPLVLILWLWVYDRRSALRLAGYGALFAVTGLLAADYFLGIDLIKHIASPRIFVLARTIGNPGTWLITGFILAAATFYLARRTTDHYAKLLAIYAAAAIALGVFFSGGEGVGSNPMFDASVAVALGAGFFIHRMRAGARAPRWSGSHTAGWFALACTALAAVVLASSLVTTRPTLFSLSSGFATERAVAKADIARLARAPGPVFCEMLSLCYWAHKTPEIDTFNLTQAFKIHARDEADLIRLLDAHYFRMIQLEPRSVFGYSPGLRCAFIQNYVLDHTDRLGAFLVPRQGAVAGCAAGPGRFPLP